MGRLFIYMEYRNGGRIGPWRTLVMGEKQNLTFSRSISIWTSSNMFCNKENRDAEDIDCKEFQVCSRFTVPYADLISRNANTGIVVW